MSLPGFDILRTRHPEATSALSRIETGIQVLLSRHPRGLINEHFVGQLGKVEPAVVAPYLTELADDGVLEPRFIWLCPQGNGAAMEVEKLEDFPIELDCTQCGQLHEYDEDAIEVEFVASPSLEAEASKPGYP